MAVFKGSGVALCTPFKDDGVNYETLGELIDFQLNGGTDALIVCGTTGEPSTMSAEEKRGVIGFAVKRVNGRIPVIAGTGGNNTKNVIADSVAAEKLGADALLVVTPYYNKCTQRGLVEHMFAVAESVSIPIIVYNVPSRTGFNIAPETLAELARHGNITAIKEASGNISQIVEMARLTRGSIDLYSGNDDHVVPMMAVGALGVISVVANVAPRDMHVLTSACLNGDYKKAGELQFKVNALSKALFTEVSPIPVKTALGLMGFDMGKLRMPLSEMSGKNLEMLKKELIDYGLLNKDD